MFRIDDATASGVLPTPETALTEGYFTEGSPGVTPATLVRASFLNMVQEELRGIVVAAGLTPSKTTYTQVRDAIRTIFQRNDPSVCAAGGTADAITGAYTPAIASLTNGMSLYVRSGSTNATSTPTFTPNNGVIATKTIVKGAGSALAAGDIAGVGHWIELQYDATLDKWVLLNPAKGITPTQGLYPGTPLMWPVPVCPAWALTRDGSAITRASYSALFAALCPTRNGTTTNGSNAVTGLSTTADLYVGMPVEATGIPAGATVSSITSSTAITISANATASATVPITLFYYGYGSGGSATTFGVPDDRGLFERGLDVGAAARDYSTVTGTTNTTTAITGISSTRGMFVGQAISGSGIPGGATIASITSATAIVISAAATASATVALTVAGNQIGNYRVDEFASHVHQEIGTNSGATGGGNVGISGPGYSGTNTAATGGTETKPKGRSYLPIIVF